MLLLKEFLFTRYNFSPHCKKGVLINPKRFKEFSKGLQPFIIAAKKFLAFTFHRLLTHEGEGKGEGEGEFLKNKGRRKRIKNTHVFLVF